VSDPAEHDSRLQLRSEELRVVVSARGGRITSLKSRDGREWLVRARADASVVPGYGVVFTDTAHCGWDEMFPSVDACAYPVAPYEGQPVPDHGELWSATWDVVKQTPETLHQRVHSERFGYTFERALTLDGATLHAEYSCVLDGEAAATVPLLWALHPQFSLSEGSRVLLSPSPSHLLDTTDAMNVRPVPWNGDLVVERDVKWGDDRMLYATPEAVVAEAAIVDRSGELLRLTWDHSFAPYLGIWMDNGRYTDQLVVALEPTNGFFDDVSRAWGSGQVGLFAPGQRLSWWVNVNVEQRGH